MAISAQCARLAADWRRSAIDALTAAKQLRSTGQNWTQVYEHAGFAVELMLKAIRIRRDGLEAWPAGDRASKWHDLSFAAQMAGLEDDLKAACKANRTFEAYWLTVKDWDNQSRYPGSLPSENDAKDMLLAVINPTNGVMKWLEQIYQTI